MGLELKINAQFRVVPHGIDSAPMQMAIDHALLDTMELRLNKGVCVQPIIRTYKFDRNAIILGKNQSRERFNGTIEGCYFTKRITGGGHMYFSTDDLHFSVIIPNEFVPKDIIECFKTINSPIVSALRDLGFNARAGRTSIKIDLDEEKTLVGSAQRKLRYAMLHHGSILVNDYTPKIFDLLKASEEEVRVWRDKIIALSSLNGKIDSNATAKSIMEKFAGSNYSEIALDAEEMELARKYYDEIYNNQSEIGKGLKRKDYICLLEGLITKDYEIHLEEHAGNAI